MGTFRVSAASAPHAASPRRRRALPLVRPAHRARQVEEIASASSSASASSTRPCACSSRPRRAQKAAADAKPDADGGHRRGCGRGRAARRRRAPGGAAEGQAAAGHASGRSAAAGAAWPSWRRRSAAASREAGVAREPRRGAEPAARRPRDLQREKETAVLAEKAKVLKLQSELADMQRKLEGKSAHELGEGSEIDLFEQLRTAFEGDRIQRVPKGVNGADVIHEVIHNGKVCGKIIYDAKNRNAWQNGFATKLNADKLVQAPTTPSCPATSSPRTRRRSTTRTASSSPSRRACWRSSRSCATSSCACTSCASARRGASRRSVELYAFITSEHCKQLLEQVEAQAGKMLDLDTKEQEAHRRLWDQRGKLIRSVQKARSDLVLRDRPHHRHRRQRPGRRGRAGVRLRHSAALRPLSPRREWRRCSRRTCRP